MMELNLVLGWVWITSGFFAGFVLGLFFHRDDWLGGYSSYKRRLYRLGHIAFFGTAIVNLFFYFTVVQLHLYGLRIGIASWGFAVGALAMPTCCFIMANAPRLRALFLIPVISMTTAGVITSMEVMRS